jgi:Flp pilus assembly protein TadD
MSERMQNSSRSCRAALTLTVVLTVAGCASTSPKPEDPVAIAPTAKMLAAADEAVRIGNLKAAVPLYAQVLHEEPTASTWMKAGFVHFRLGNDREAGYAFDQAIELEPDNADAHEQIGLLYVAHQRIEPARVHLERAVVLDPTRWRAQNGLGVLADLQHDYPAAVVHYRGALDIKPDSAMLLNNLGYSMYLAGDLDNSAIKFVEAITRDTRYEPARRNLGLLYARKGAYADAVELLATVMTEAAAYNDVGYMAMQRGDYPAAENLLKEAVDRSPTYYQIAAENLTRVKQLLREQLAFDTVLQQWQAKYGLKRGL